MFSPFQKKKSRLEQQQSREDLDMRRDLDEPQEEVSLNSTPSEVKEEPSSSVLINKGLMDKSSLDLVFAVEQMIKDKQHVEMSHNDLQDRLNHSNGQNDRLNRDLKNLGKVIEEREKSILELERKLADKNLKVDQIMEDFRELQSTMSGQNEELKGVIELERQNYAGLLQKHNEMITDKNKRISELEEKNVRYESELTQMKQKFDALRQEKTHLLNVVNDFTNRLTSPFASNAGTTEESPID
jgi:chromosome segregation ATPase